LPGKNPRKRKETKKKKLMNGSITGSNSKATREPPECGLARRRRGVGSGKAPGNKKKRSKAKTSYACQVGEDWKEQKDVTGQRGSKEGQKGGKSDEVRVTP